jgi:hypothetical protein
MFARVEPRVVEWLLKRVFEWHGGAELDGGKTPRFDRGKARLRDGGKAP